MSDQVFDYSEFSKFADSISNWDTLAMNSAKKAMPDATDYLLSKIPEYPEETLGRLEPRRRTEMIDSDRLSAASANFSDVESTIDTAVNYAIENGLLSDRVLTKIESYRGELEENLSEMEDMLSINSNDEALEFSENALDNANRIFDLLKP